jgi:translation elongation factor P/translation initiation factor 5A
MAALEVDGIYVEAANDIRKGGYMVMNNGKSPCKVIEISKSKPGKFCCCTFWQLTEVRGQTL